MANFQNIFENNNITYESVLDGQDFSFGFFFFSKDFTRLTNQQLKNDPDPKAEIELQKRKDCFVVIFDCLYKRKFKNIEPRLLSVIWSFV